MNVSEEVAKALLDIKAVTLSPTHPYTWASGIESPIYCDNRITISVPSVRKKIAQSLAELIKETYPEVEVIAGTATAGIPHAAFVAQILDLPMIYIRSEAKKHGKTNRIEGLLEKGQNVVLIEDLISTGGSVIEAAKATEEAGANVLGCVAIFTYEMELGKKNFATSGFELHCLSNYSTLLKVAQKEDYISDSEFDLLIDWSKDPEHWRFPL